MIIFTRRLQQCTQTTVQQVLQNKQSNCFYMNKDQQITHKNTTRILIEQNKQNIFMQYMYLLLDDQIPRVVAVRGKVNQSVENALPTSYTGILLSLPMVLLYTDGSLVPVPTAMPH